MFVLYLVTFVITLFYILKKLHRNPKELPGPFRWPILGNLPQIATINWERVWFPINHYAQIYGDIMGLYFGPRYTVVLSHPDIVHEVMKRNEWNGRAKDHMAKIKSEGNIRGLILTDGELWKETRRFSLRHLRDFGFGKTNMETSISEEVKNIINHLTEGVKANNGIMSFENTFGPAVLSTLWNMVAGTPCNVRDSKIIDLQKTVTLTLRRRAIGAGIVWSFQWLRHMFPEWSGFAEQLRGFEKLKQHMREVIQQHKENYNPAEIRDFIDAYLQEKEKNPHNNHYFDEQLAVTCMDFFVAGSDTTTTTLKFCILYLMLHPEVQVKAQKEIESVMGSCRPITLQDRENLPYTEAILLETHRYASVAPIVTPHALTESVEYKGYRIPEGSLVFINTWGMHRNEKHWGDPENFRPERFIDYKGKVLPADEWLLPFGSGKRRCPGEVMAKASIFLIISNLIQRFSFNTIPGQEKPSTIPIVGLNLAPQPYLCLVKQRC